MLTTSSPQSQVIQNPGEVQLRVSLVPLTHEMSPVELTTGTYEIGSSADCAIQIDVPGVAAKHCIIDISRTEVSIRAIDPRVWVNERPVRKFSLSAGMSFYVGPIGILVDAVTKISVDNLSEQSSPENTPTSRSQIEIPEELESTAKFQQLLAERQILLKNIETEQMELQREIQLQESELVKLHEQFSLNQESNQTPAKPTTQLPFDDAILELDQKLSQLELLKEDVSRSQEQLLSQQHELRGEHQRLLQLNETLKYEQNEITEAQQKLTDAWLDLETQQACKQVERETENAFLEKWISEQGQRQESVFQAEQRCLSYEQELIEEHHRLESWTEDLQAKENTLRDMQTALSEQKAALDLKQQSDANQEEVHQNLTQQTAQLQEERDQLAEARRALADQQVQLENERKQLQQREQSAQEISTEFEQKTAQLKESESQVSQQQQELTEQLTALEQRQSDLSSQEADLKTQLENLEKQQEEFSLQLRQFEEQKTCFETEKQECESARTALEQDQIAFESLTNETAEQHQQQQDELQKQRDKLETDREQCVERQSELEHERTELNSIQEQTKAHEQSLNEREANLKALQEEIDARKLNINSEQNCQAADTEEYEQAEAKLKSDREQFAKQQADLEQDQTKLDLKKQELAKNEELLAEREAQLASKEQELEALIAEQKSQSIEQEELDRLQVELEQKQAELKTQEEQLNTREQELSKQVPSDTDQQTAIDELAKEKQELAKNEELLAEREAQLASKEQELEALIAEQKSQSIDQEDLDRLQLELDQKQAELKTQEEQLNTREQELSEQDPSDVDQQTAIDELAKDKQKLALDHDQLKIDREEINHQRDNLELQRVQIQKERGELEDREQVINIREQQLAEREELIAEIGLKPIDNEVMAVETELQNSLSSEKEEPTILEDSIEETTQPPGSLLQSFIEDSTKEPSPAEAEASEVKSGSLLDLFKMNSEPETAEIENTSEQSPLVTEPAEVETEPAELKEEPAEINEALSTDNVEETNSIADYMEKLLERSRGGKSENTNLKVSDSKQSHSASSEPIQDNSSLLTNSLTETQDISMEAKLEMFNKAPTHSQDKDAVRDAMNSFRDVANHSARMAIARHSMKNRRTDFAFKGVLTGVCVLTTVIIFAESIWGTNSLGTMKWAALAVSVISVTLFLRTCNEAKKLFHVKNSTKSNTTEENTDLDSETQSISDEETSEASLFAVKGIQELQKRLSAEQEELQLLGVPLQKNNQAQDEQTVSVPEAENQNEIPEAELGVDQ